MKLGSDMNGDPDPNADAVVHNADLDMSCKLLCNISLLIQTNKDSWAINKMMWESYSQASSRAI